MGHLVTAVGWGMSGIMVGAFLGIWFNKHFGS